MMAAAHNCLASPRRDLLRSIRGSSDSNGSVWAGTILGLHLLQALEPVILRSLSQAPSQITEPPPSRKRISGHVSTSEYRRRVLVLRDDVNHALEKLDDGRYGECERCHCTIHGMRLATNPTAHLCSDCESNLKQRSCI